MSNPETPTVERFKELIERYRSMSMVMHRGVDIAYALDVFLPHIVVLQADRDALAAERERLTLRLHEHHETIVTLTECADAANERARGYEHIIDQTLTRAEQAEQEIARLTTENAALRALVDPQEPQP